MALHEGEDVELLHLAVREETVDRVLFVGEYLKHGFELGKDQEFDVAP